MCSPPDMIKTIKDNNRSIGGAYDTAFVIEMRKQYRILICNSSGRKHTESPTCTSDNNIQIGLTEAGGRMSSELIGSGWAVVNTATNQWGFLYKRGDFLST